jgi:hypothetical protein
LRCACNASFRQQHVKGDEKVEIRVRHGSTIAWSDRYVAFGA